MSDLATKRSNIAKSRERMMHLKERRKLLKEKLEKELADLNKKERRIQQDFANKLLTALEELGVEFYSSNGIAVIIGATLKAMEHPSNFDTYVSMGENHLTPTTSLNDLHSSLSEELAEEHNDE